MNHITNQPVKRSHHTNLGTPLPHTYARPQMSHIIPPGQFLSPPTNVAIPTIPFTCLKGLHGNYVRHCWGTMPATPATPAMLTMPAMPGLSTPARQLPALQTQPAPHTQKQPRPRPTGIGDEAGAGSAEKRGDAYSLTPPAVRPETMYFCRYWNSRITGMAAMTEPAAKMPHGAVRSSDAHMYMPTARVNWL